MKRSVLVTLLADPSAVAAAEGATAGGFQGVAYSGGLVPNFGWSGDMAIDLASLTMPESEIPVLRNHDPNQIVGRARLSNDGKSVQVMAGRFSSVTDVSRETSALMAEGHPWKLSIAVNGKYESADRAKPMKLNGRSMQLDSVLRNARIAEFSFVPSGADPNAYAAQLSSRHGTPSPQAGADEMDELERLQARVTELEGQNTTLTGERDTARTDLKAAKDAATAAALAQRNARLTAIFGEKPTLTDAQLAAYRGMSDDQFAAVEATLAAVTTAGDPALFQRQAGEGRDPDAGAARGAFVPPAGYTVDAERGQLHAKALKYQAEHAGATYLTAISAVAH